jgi:hypothetical protein
MTAVRPFIPTPERLMIFLSYILQVEQGHEGREALE